MAVKITRKNCQILLHKAKKLCWKKYENNLISKSRKKGNSSTPLLIPGENALVPAPVNSAWVRVETKDSSSDALSLLVEVCVKI